MEVRKSAVCDANDASSHINRLRARRAHARMCDGVNLTTCHKRHTLRLPRLLERAKTYV
jgi:hypothetical protein